MPLATFSKFQDGPTRNKSTAILVFGEHAREIITCEVGLWLSRVFVGDTAELFSWEEWRNAFKPLGVAPDQIQATVQGWVQRILDNLIVKMIPIENVDGRQLWEGGNLCLRKTAKGVDLNRQYSFAFANEPPHSEMYGGPHPFSEAQSRMIARLALEGGGVPKAYINVHSGEWAVYSGWDSKAAVGPGMPADLTDVIVKSGELCGCQAGPAGAVSNYLAFGTGMDFMYTQLGVPYALTYEVYGMAQLGAAGKVGPGDKARPLETYPLESDDRIARTLPRIEDLLPAPTGFLPLGRQHHHHAEHQRVAAAWARRAAWEAAGGTGRQDGAALDGLATGAEAGAGGREGARRRRASGVRRMFWRREAANEAYGSTAQEEAAALQHRAGSAWHGSDAVDGGRGLEAGRWAAGASGGGLGARMLRAAERSSGHLSTALAAGTSTGGTDADGASAAGDDTAAGAMSAVEEANGDVGIGSLLARGGRSMRRLAEAAAAAVGDVGLGDGALAEAEASVFDSLAGEEAGASSGAGSSDEQGPRRDLQSTDIASFGGPDGPVIAMVRSKMQMYQSCFDMFNPPPGTVYRDVISRWVVILLWTLDHVADPANPKPSAHPLPGTVLAGGGMAGGHHHHHHHRRRRQLMQSETHGAAGRVEEGHEGPSSGASAGGERIEADVSGSRNHPSDKTPGTSGASGSAAEPRVVKTSASGGASGAGLRHGSGASGQGERGGSQYGSSQYGSAAFDQRVQERVYEVDPVMRQHSLVVLIALFCLGAVFVPWWMMMMKRPPGSRPPLPQQQQQQAGFAGRRSRVPSRGYLV